MTKQCPRCYTINRATNAVCARCGLPFGATVPIHVTAPFTQPIVHKSNTALGGGLLALLALVLLGIAILLVALHNSAQVYQVQGGVLPDSPVLAATIQPALQATDTADQTTAQPALQATATAQQVASLISIPTVTPAARQTMPNVIPTLTATPIQPAATAVQNKPTAEAPATNTPIPPTQPAQANNTSGSAAISPYLLKGAYKRDDGKLYGREEIALYGAGSTYEQGTVAFTVKAVPDVRIGLDLLGLDDERADHCHMQIVLNGTIIYDDANTFPNVPTNDNGEGGSDRFWGHMRIAIPTSALNVGANSLTIRNLTPWNGQLGIPYILISNATVTVTG